MTETPETEYDEQLEFELGDGDKVWASLLYSFPKKVWSIWWIDSNDGEEYEKVVENFESLTELKFYTISLGREDIIKYVELRDKYIEEVGNNA